MGLRQTLDVFVSVARELHANRIVAIGGERVIDGDTAARAKRQPVEMRFLRQIWRHEHDARCRRP